MFPLINFIVIRCIKDEVLYSEEQIYYVVY